MKKQTKNQIDHLVRRVARLEIDQWRKADHQITEAKLADLVTSWRDMDHEENENALDGFVANDKSQLIEALVHWKGRQKKSGAAQRKKAKQREADKTQDSAPTREPADETMPPASEEGTKKKEGTRGYDEGQERPEACDFNTLEVLVLQEVAETEQYLRRHHRI